jgi:hypothetical protein
VNRAGLRTRRPHRLHDEQQSKLIASLRLRFE